MNGAVNPASIAISTAIGTSLLAGAFSIWIAMRSPKGAAATRDTTVSIFFGLAVLLIALNGTAATLIAARVMASFGLLKATLLLTASFALAGMGVGLMRALRSARAIKTLGA